MLVQVHTTGNRCGHDPKKPRLALAVVGTRPGSKPFPWLIRCILERLPLLYTDRRLFKGLGPRKRSERIEAMVLVAMALVRNLCRLTLRCGRPGPDGTFNGITAKTIGKWAGITEQRAFRAIWDFRDAGWIECTQPIEERANGDRRGLAGIRQFRMRFFDALGLAAMVARERKAQWVAERAERWKEKAETIAEGRARRRLFRSSKRAVTLARRTRSQLAERTGTPIPAAAAAADERAAAALIEFQRRILAKD